MNALMAIEEIIRSHPLGIGRAQIESEIVKAQIKGGSPANDKRVLARLLKQKRVIVEGRSVARIYKPASPMMSVSSGTTMNCTTISISNTLLEEVKRKAESLGICKEFESGSLIDSVLRNWIIRTGPVSLPQLLGHVERIEWVLELLRSNASANGRVGPVGIKHLAKEFDLLYPDRKLSASFIRSAIKELVLAGKLRILNHRAGPVGCIYQIT